MQFHVLLPCFGSLSGCLLFLVLVLHFAFFSTTSSSTSSGMPILPLGGPVFAYLPRGEALAHREVW